MDAKTGCSITGLGALSALGHDVPAHRFGLLEKVVPFQFLGKLLGPNNSHAATPAAWIEPRGLLNHRKWSPASMAALIVARQAITAARWTSADCRDAAIVLGTSRGNAAGWLDPWPGRRPFRLMAASNTIHSEPATAISIECGILGPNHVIANGCAAGLDAAGLAMMMIQSGVVDRALAVAVDLPLVEILLDNYRASGLLSMDCFLDPYGEKSNGFIPAEGAAAMALERKREGNFSQLLFYASNADGCDPVGIPADGGRTPELISLAEKAVGRPAAICPHATGTRVQAVADPAWLNRCYLENRPSLHLLKPQLGHAIGASGLLESVVLCAFLEQQQFPPNIPNLTEPNGFHLPTTAIEATGIIYNISHGMGGHNSLIALSAP
ncbi:MAG: hypothetical protein EAZ42_09145 [Verrucomicrobia bacterium]|nr:MAG: hypothetical protein EAZ42_09145 [Verrucomicrobiota bacterium]